MKYKNRIVYVTLLICLCNVIFTACGKKSGSMNKGSEPSIKIVSTIFPQYDWVREIIGEDASIDNSYLLDSGIDLHSFQPTTEDIYNILSSDIFIYVGGESEEWVQGVLAQDTKQEVRVICLMDILEDSLKEEELVEGMQSEGDGEHEGHTDEQEEHMEEEYDEHVWMSLRNASQICDVLEEVLSEIMPENADIYRENTDIYIEKLNQLDAEIALMTQNSKKKTIVVGDRFPFRYLVDDYQIKYYAAFSGCSAETEASFETIVYLAQQMEANQLGNILVTETSDQKIAATILQNAKSYPSEILILNSMQAVTKSTATVMTYLGTMQQNYEVLKEALEG